VEGQAYTRFDMKKAIVAARRWRQSTVTPGYEAMALKEYTPTSPGIAGDLMTVCPVQGSTGQGT